MTKGTLMRGACLGSALLIVGGVACSSNDAGTTAASSTSPTPVVTPTPTTPAPTPSPPALTCKQAKAVDLSGDDPFTIAVRHFKFTPACFIASAEAAIAIVNKDDVNHTFSIDGTLVNAPLTQHHTYRHSGGGGFLTPGTAYPFHCTIHPQMTGTWFVV